MASFYIITTSLDVSLARTNIYFFITILDISNFEKNKSPFLSKHGQIRHALCVTYKIKSILLKYFAKFEKSYHQAMTE